MGVIKVLRSNVTLSGKIQWKWHWSFSEDSHFFSKIHSCKNTRAAFQFWNVLCTVYWNQVQLLILLENLFVAVSFDIVMGATNKSMNGKHWTLPNGHNLSDNNNTNYLKKYSYLQWNVAWLSNVINSLDVIMTANVMKEKFNRLRFHFVTISKQTFKN